MSSFGGGREKRNVLDAFPWSMKSVSSFIDKRRKSKQGESTQITLSRQDIRTAYISLILSFVDRNTASSVKLAFLENRLTFSSVFTDISQDSLEVLKRTLHVAWEGIWGDTALPLKLKVGLFMEKTLQDIAKLYDRSEPERLGEDAPADVAHHFLMAICTRPGTGICFKSRGWYPRQLNAFETGRDDRRPSKLYNTVLLHFITTLKANDDVRQQELVLKVLEACPELVAEYWEKGGLSLEPRLKSRWISNISLAARVIALPVPTASLRVSNGTQFDLTPPPCERIVSSIIPSTLLSSHLTRGLKSTSQMVRLLTANMVSKSLQKYGMVIEVMDEAHITLEEDALSGAWAAGQREVASLVSQQVPAFATVVEMLQDSSRKSKTSSKGPDKEQGAPLTSPATSRQHRLLSEAVTRLMWLYHRYLPEVVAESAQRVRLALTPFRDGEVDGSKPLAVLNQLHSFRLLGELDHVSLSIKTGDNNRSIVYQMLHYQLTTPYEAVRQAGGTLLSRLLSNSVLFEHDPSEIELWLSCLPSTRPQEMTDGGDQVEGFLRFFEDCLLRCLKTPYKYLEESLAICSDCDQEGTTPAHSELLTTMLEHSIAYGPTTAPSPLLFTILEQLRLKIAGNHISADDCYPVFYFLRRFLIRLAAKHPDMQYTRRVAQIVGDLVLIFAERMDEKDTFEAVLREVRILRCTLAFETDSNTPAGGSEPDHIEISGAEVSEIINHLRSRKVSPSPMAIATMTKAAAQASRAHSAMQEYLLQLVDPEILWTSLSLEGEAGALARHSVPFHWAYLRAGAEELSRAENITVLVDCFTAEARQSPSAAMRNMETVLLRLQDDLATHPHSGAKVARWSLHILVKSVASLPMNPALKSSLFASPYVRHLCCSMDQTFGGLLDILCGLISGDSPADRQAVKRQCNHWAIALATTQAQAEVIPFASRWLEFMEPEDTLKCIDAVVPSIFDASQRTQAHVAFVERSLVVFCSHHAGIAGSSLTPRLGSLLSLATPMKGSKMLATAILMILQQVFPYGHDGRLSSGGLSLPGIIAVADHRWQTRRFNVSELADDFFSSLLHDNDLSTEAMSIAATLVRLKTQARLCFAKWLLDNTPKRPVLAILPVLDVFLDIALSDSGQRRNEIAEALQLVVMQSPSLFKAVFNAQAGSLQREHCANCIAALVQLLPDQGGRIRRVFCDAIEAAPHSAMLLWEAVTLLNELGLGKRFPYWSQPEGPISLAVESGLKWLVRRFAEDPKDSVELLQSLEQFDTLISNTNGIKAYVAEPVLTAAIQHRLGSAPVVQFASCLVQSVALKPVNVNRLIQSTVQHSSFYSYALDLSDESPRPSIIDLLHVLFLSHPSNTCQPSHIAPLIRVYLGTQSFPDRQLLSIFHLFEHQRRVSVASLVSRWSASPGSTSSNSGEALTSLDASIASRTYTSFPQKRWMDVTNLAAYRGLRATLYDPVFVLTLMGTCLVDGSITTPLAWSEVGRTNAISIAIAAMSSKEPGVRSLAITVLTGVWRGFQTIPLHERDHVLLILNHLRHLLPSPSSSSAGAPAVPRLPTYVTLLLAHAMQCVFYPQNFLYPTIMRFLLQRPEMETRDVPMLYTSLYSNSDDWRRERSWIVRLLADGMVNTADWTMFKRRHTWDLLATLFQESAHEPVLRQSILQVLLNLTTIEEAARSLVVKGGLLGWMEVQTDGLLKGEELSWLKVFENVLVMVGIEKLEKSSAGLWKESMSRSLSTLLRRQGAIEHLFLAARILVQVSAFNTTTSLSLLDHAVGWLQAVESSMSTGDPSAIPSPSSAQAAPVFVDAPHTGLRADPLAKQSDSQVWGEIVEMLWQVSMTLPSGQRTGDTSWSRLTSRLLVWNAMQRGAGARDQHRIGEWARRQSLASLTAV
ncbi:hypothetical protein FRB95_009056 [Tulasnella sp. JGI-2019a]|nr:hypothetical protein FRB95_009056 [Tulasnella sp. JGI-2019a]